MTTPSTDRAQRLYPNTVRVLNHLITTQATVAELAAALHLAGESVQWAVDVLRGLGLVHVGGWARKAPQGPPAKVWAAGEGVDAPRPEPLATAEKTKAWRSRGGDSHRARKIGREMARISQGATLAGMLGVRNA